MNEKGKLGNYIGMLELISHVSNNLDLRQMDTTDKTIDNIIFTKQSYIAYLDQRIADLESATQKQKGVAKNGHY